MDLIEYSDQLGKAVKENRKLARTEQEKMDKAKDDLAKAQKQHEENKKQGML